MLQHPLCRPMVIPLSPVQPQHRLHLWVPTYRLSALCNTVSACPQYAHSRGLRTLAHSCVLSKAEQLSAWPKREIHPPAPKDLPYADMPKKMRKAKVPKDDGIAEQLKYYAKILSDLR
jgi:hypothetical protein